MFDLDSIYSDHKIEPENPLCDGCSILNKKKPCHSVMDYKSISQSDVLFLSDSLKTSYGKTYPFTKPEYAVIKEAYKEGFACAASVKCPTVKEADMSPDNMNLCRVHLQATVDKVKPKLIFPCGNLAMKMLIKKSGISDKRGKSFEYETEAGHKCTVVPIYHPYFVAKEPRHKFLFETDIRNAYEKYILHKESKGDFKYKVLTKIEEVESLAEQLQSSEETLAVDIETTGLNFLTDLIQTIALSSHKNTWVIPLDHKDSPFKEQPKVWVYLRRILENPKNKKVFHNAKFDLKFLINYGIYTKNVWDTKIMHHLLDENLPKSLMDLVKLYFPTELESL